MIMKMIFLALLLTVFPQVRFDRMVHDFGMHTVSDGPLSCEFTVSNDGDEPVSILTVIANCDCTRAEWTRESIEKGGQGKIKISYSNDEGAYPFDKAVSVYLSSRSKPYILHVKGVVTKNGK